jgi:hypothetical protein
MKPKLLLITANLLMLLSISPQASYAADDPRVGKLLSQSGTALHVDALRSAEVIHVRPKNVGVDNDLAARGFNRRTFTKGAERFNLSTRRLSLALKRSRRSSCWL